MGGKNIQYGDKGRVGTHFINGGKFQIAVVRIVMADSERTQKQTADSNDAKMRAFIYSKTYMHLKTRPKNDSLSMIHHTTKSPNIKQK